MAIPFTQRALATLLMAGLLSIGLSIGLSDAAAAPPPAPGKIADEQLFSYLGKDPLPAGTIPWQVLRQVKVIETTDVKTKATSSLPSFGGPIKELDKQTIKLYGFVMPLSTGAKQKHFLLSPLPSHCPYCVFQGPDSIVEVLAPNGVEYNQWDPIVVSGKFELVNDQYLFYRLTDAKLVKP